MLLVSPLGRRRWVDGTPGVHFPVLRPLASSLFACSQIGAAHREDFSRAALPRSRSRSLRDYSSWASGLSPQGGGTSPTGHRTTCSRSADTRRGGWPGSARSSPQSGPSSLSLPRMLEAAANYVPATVWPTPTPISYRHSVAERPSRDRANRAHAAVSVVVVEEDLFPGTRHGWSRRRPAPERARRARG